MTSNIINAAKTCIWKDRPALFVIIRAPILKTFMDSALRFLAWSYLKMILLGSELFDRQGRPVVRFFSGVHFILARCKGHILSATHKFLLAGDSGHWRMGCADHLLQH